MSVSHKSKYKNIYGNESKEKYQGVRVCTRSLESPGLSVSLKYIAVPLESGGGGLIGIVDLDDIGTRCPHVTRCSGHKSLIQDLCFSPFYDNLLASVSDDTTIKLWSISNYGKTLESRTITTLSGHDRRVYRCAFNGLVESIIATVSQDCTTRIWDIESEKEIFCSQHDAPVQDVKWNFTGSLLAVTSKNKTLQISDPRSPEIKKLKTVCHGGVKGSKVCWLGGPVTSEHFLLTTGVEKGPGRQAALWDIRSFDHRLQTVELGLGSGSIFPEWDPETGLVILPGKGDGIMRIFEVYDNQIFTNKDYRSAEPARAFGFLPKRGVNCFRNEILRCYKVDSGNNIQPIEFIIPRKSAEFQEDLYNLCFSGCPALTKEDWLEKKSAIPVRSSMHPKENGEIPFKPKYYPQAEKGTKTELQLTPLPSKDTPALSPAVSLSSVSVNAVLDYEEMTRLSEEFKNVSEELSQLKKKYSILLQQKEDAEKKKNETEEQYIAVAKELSEAKQRTEELEQIFILCKRVMTTI